MGGNDEEWCGILGYVREVYRIVGNWWKLLEMGENGKVLVGNGCERFIMFGNHHHTHHNHSHSI